MEKIAAFRQMVEEGIERLVLPPQPSDLYEPIRYILSLGGKRMRPVLLLMGNDLFGGDPKKALPQALAIELFHNFSLIHDDIMDQAPVRRGQPTVHHKWNTNVGILSGDAMLVKAYELLADCESLLLPSMIRLFNRTALEVCEGQQFDMDYEKLQAVSVSDYTRMITLKTAVLLGVSLEMGAILAGAKDEDSRKLYQFGKNLGIAFQMRDDLLDAFGDEEKFGKKKGGDISANKKTFLFLFGLENANEKDKARLLELYSIRPDDDAQKINEVLEIFERNGVRERTDLESRQYFEKAMEDLGAISVSEEAKAPLVELAESLMVREN